MLHPQGGGSHTASADTLPCEVPLTGLSVTPITGTLWLHPREPTALTVLSTSSAQARTRTGRIGPMLPTPTAPFSDSTFIQYSSRTPSARAKERGHFLYARSHPSCPRRGSPKTETAGVNPSFVDERGKSGGQPWDVRDQKDGEKHDDHDWQDRPEHLGHRFAETVRR